MNPLILFCALVAMFAEWLWEKTLRAFRSPVSALRFLLPLLLLTGCGMEKARRAEPVSFGKLERAHANAAQGLATANDRHAAASRAVATSRSAITRARTGLAAQRSAHAALAPRVADLARNVPPDLRPEVEAIETQLADLASRTDTISADTDAAETAAAEATAAQNGLGSALEQTNAAVAEARTETATATKAALDAVTKANHNADLTDQAQARVRELERKNWIRRALEALAAIALLAGAVAWFTGKLTLTGLRSTAAVANAAR